MQLVIGEIHPDRREPMFHLAFEVPLLPLTQNRPALPLFLKLPRESQRTRQPTRRESLLFIFKGGLRPLAAYAASPLERPVAERREPKYHPATEVP